MMFTSNNRILLNLQRRMKRPKTYGPFWIRGNTEKHMEEQTHGAIVQKQGLHQYRTVVKARNCLNQSL